ncbi:TonB-dependent receptor plug domain-containing protein [Nitrosomonas sp.]|uniref:TonB-dependent receptor plug domain-containing protein n=1 Tax=Nitrosomonas sp. TaxID=42353 RepID=UPI001DBC7208|nr:TonB-dependent receptor [Nitrosomonas sp.]MBX3615878.1 TonB-dependent receptor [Nitrosomonas sp.]
MSVMKLSFSDNKLIDSSLLYMSIEELMNVKVITVSRTPQKLAQVASAIFVITQDDIRRSGATSIPDALRMAPGVQVERIGTDKWAISIRGFNGIFANKLQVLMDGRSVYTPIFSGVLWEQQDTLMEDIERIEVIRGPATTSWGSNAVNGVINIITKRATDTQGMLFTVGGGSFEHGFIGARYGGMINEETPFRVYAKGFSRGHTQSISGENANDQWHSARGGFRLDHHRGIDQFTLQGDYFSNFEGSLLDKNALYLSSNLTGGMRVNNQGGNIRFRWDRTFSESSSFMLQAYYDRTQSTLQPIGRFDADSFDVDIQYRFRPFDRHQLTWGSNYRLYHNKVFDTDLLAFSPRARSNHLIGTFIRDDITLIPDRLLFTLGSRFEHNDFTGMEIQPSARLMWTPNPENSFWLAVSRAVRTPSRVENDGKINITPFLLPALGPEFSNLVLPISATLFGNKHFGSEKLIAYELGYRHQFSPQASIDIAAFINDYSQLRDVSFGALSLITRSPIQFLQPVYLNNQGSALTYGIETSIDWKPKDTWRLQGSYSFLDINFSSSSFMKDINPTTGGTEKANPQHQLSFRSNYDLSEKLQLNLWLRYTSKIALYDIPSYVTMDAKLVYKPVRNTELFVVGQNLFKQNHREIVSDFIPIAPGYIPRGIYAGIQWRF